MNRRAGFTIMVAYALVALVPWQARGAAMQTFQATGNYTLEISAVSQLAGQLPSMTGTFMLSQMPPGATVHKAFVYTGDWNNGAATLSLAFPGVVFPGILPIGPMASETTLAAVLDGYRWDVSPYIMGVPSSYSFTIGSNFPLPGTQGNQLGGAALVVVWSSPLVPVSTVTIVDGAIQVGEHTPTLTDTESMTFSGLPAGPTSLYTFTVSDSGGPMFTGETVDYNGNTIGGPIDENLGLGASLLAMNAPSLSGSNTLSITSPADHMGWIFSAAIVPEPSTFALAALGMLSVLSYARRRWRCSRAGSRTNPRLAASEGLR